LFRYFNASGADPNGEHGEDRKRETHLIPLTLFVPLGRHPQRVLFGDRFPTRDGTCERDYVHVDDLASAHQLGMEELRPGEVRSYNLGVGHGFTVREVHAACEKVVGAPIPFEIAEPRPGDPAVLVASSAKARRELGGSPRYTEIDPIVETAWRWHRAHPRGYGEREPEF